VRANDITYQFSHAHSGQKDRNNPYCLDVINALFEIKREGLVRSISTKNFPPSLLQMCLKCGFDVSSNDVCGNFMNTNNLQLKNDLGVSRLISAPLGGGLFTNRFSQIQKWEQLSPSGKKIFTILLDSCCKMQTTDFDSSQPWEKYRSIVNIIVELSLKYQVSVESIALRWLLQLNEGENISVGTSMGMDLREKQGGKQFSRQRDMRQVFTFSLEEYDMELLCNVCNLDHRSGMTVENQIDFTSRRLWM
jgi:aryl-alcohol dehydrogenase-like predicted oxidoreductase